MPISTPGDSADDPDLPHPGLAPEDRPRSVFDAAYSGGAAFVTVTGLSGIGKSTWMRQFAAASRNCRVVEAAADAFESRIQFAFADKIAHAAGLRSGVLTGEETPDLATIARNTLAAVLSANGNNRRLCLLIDNAQWIDDSSATVLRYMASRLVHSGVLVVLGGLEPQTGDAAAHILGKDTAAWGLIRRIGLEPLDDRAVRAYVSAVHRKEVSLRLAGRIRQRCGGLPLLIDASVAAMELPSAPARSHWQDDVVFAAPETNPFHGLAESWPPPVRACLDIVCTLGGGVEPAEVEAIAARLGMEHDMGAAIASGLLTTGHAAGGAAKVAPFHDLFAADIVARVAEDRRVAILSAAAGTVSNEYRAFSFRLEAAGRLDPALEEETRQMVAVAVSARQPGMALDYLRRAVALADGPRRDSLIVETCLLAAALLDSPSVIDLIPDLERMPADPVRDLALLQTKQITGDVGWARKRAARLLDEPLDHPDAALIRAHLAMMAVMIQLTTDDYAPLAAQLDRVRALVADLGSLRHPPADRRLEPLDDAQSLALRVSALTIVTAQRVQDPARAAREFPTLSAAIDDAPDSPALADALVCRGGAMLHVGEAAAAAADLERSLAVSNAAGAGWSHGHAQASLAHAYWILGRYDEARTVIEAATMVALDTVDVSARPLIYFARALLAGTSGDTATYAASLRTAAEVTVTDYDTAGAELELAAQAEEARAAGRYDDVLRAVSEASVVARWLPSRSVFSYRVDALAASGRPDEADRLLAELRALDGAGWWPVYGSLEWLEGRVEEAYGLVEAAGRSYLKAVRRGAEDPRFPLGTAIARLDAGRMQVQMGRRSAGTANVHAAAAAFRSLGADPYLRRALAELSGDAPDAVAGLELLTSREREVALRAGGGETNAEIARALFVSVPTVRFHMRNVLAKLGLSSRRELRPFASAG